MSRRGREGGGGLVCGRGKKEERQACVHNEQDELKGEEREMRGIQKCIQRAKRDVGVCTCVKPRGGGEQAQDREEGLDRAPEAVWRERNCLF